jgi:hypothetical protein
MTAAYREPDRNPGRHSMSQPLEPLSTARHKQPADGASWGYRWMWIPGAILTSHALSF